MNGDLRMEGLKQADNFQNDMMKRRKDGCEQKFFFLGPNTNVLSFFVMY